MGTKREHHSAVISRGCTPHSFWLYGIMKWREMPAPNFFRQKSSKFFGGSAERGSLCARTKSMQALAHDLRRQAVQVGLERIAREHAVRKDARLALDRHHLPGQELGDQLLHVRIAQVQPVAGLVEVEAARLVGARVAAEARLLLDEEPGAAQVEGGRDPGQAAAEDDHPRVRVRRVLHRRTLSIARYGRLSAQSSVMGGGPPGSRTLGASDLAQLLLAGGLARLLRYRHNKRADTCARQWLWPRRSC